MHIMKQASGGAWTHVSKAPLIETTPLWLDLAAKLSREDPEPIYAVVLSADRDAKPDAARDWFYRAGDELTQ